MALELAVESRDTQGKHRNRRLRQSGKIPGILYGHGLECVPLSVEADVLTAAIRHGSRLVSLTGAVNESAFIRDLQWDTWGRTFSTSISRGFRSTRLSRSVCRSNYAASRRACARGAWSCSISMTSKLLPCLADSRKVGGEHQSPHARAVDLLGSLELPAGAKVLAGDLDEAVVEWSFPSRCRKKRGRGGCRRA